MKLFKVHRGPTFDSVDSCSHVMPWACHFKDASVKKLYGDKNQNKLFHYELRKATTTHAGRSSLERSSHQHEVAITIKDVVLPYLNWLLEY